MIGRVTIRDAIRATVGAADLVERMSGQMEKAFHPISAGDSGPCRPSIQVDGESIVSAQRGQVLQRITAEDLLTLPEDSIRRVLMLERVMQNHYEHWVRVYPKLVGRAEGDVQPFWRQELRGIVSGMQNDVDEVLRFLEQAGLRMDDHYAHVRNMIRSIGSEGMTEGNGSDGTGFPHT